jgi:hypothetical protein
MLYDTIVFKPYYENKTAYVRAFCGDCFKPQKMKDDDLADILAASDFCQCERWVRDD